MKAKIVRMVLLFHIFFWLYTSLIAQTDELALKINKAENNLLEPAAIIFTDSVVPRYNIYDRMKHYKVPSVSIAVVNNGKLEWAKAYGLADIHENRKADINTLYQAASISKSLNAICIMKLVQDGKLSLDKDIRGYLKTWRFPDNDLSKDKIITIKNLLNHTAGLSLHGFRGYSLGEKIPAINEILDGKFPANNEAVIPIYAPGSKREYSGGGTLITKKIIDDNITANYDSLMKAEVLTPLGMINSSYIDPLNSGIKNFAAAHEANMIAKPGKYHLYPELAPDGLWTTPADISKFIFALQKSITEESGGFLNGTLAKEMTTPALNSDGSALGVFIQEIGGEKYFMHTGANEGFRTVFYGSFKTGRGFTIMVNSDNGQIIDEIINSIAEVYNLKGFYAPEERKLVSISDSLENRYKGIYESENPQIRIKIDTKGGSLHLTTKGDDNLERMLFVSESKFYLPSSPNTFAEFLNGPGSAKTLIVKENGNVIIKAAKTK